MFVSFWTDALAANVYDEWRRIQKRRKIIGDSPPGSPPSSDKQPCSLSKTSPFHSANTSPFHNTATSPFHNANSLPFHSANHQIQNMPFFSMSFGQQQQQQLQVPHQQSSSNSSSTVAGSSKKQPTFTMKQVVLLCERLWKEREEKLREEYNQVLNARLSGKVKPFLLLPLLCVGLRIQVVEPWSLKQPILLVFWLSKIFKCLSSL